MTISISDMYCKYFMNEVRSFRPVGILLGSAFPAKIGGIHQQRVRPETGRTRLQLRLKIQYLQSPECVWAGRHKLCLPALSAKKRGGRRQSMARSVNLDLCRLAAAALRPFPICKPQNNFGSRRRNYAVNRSSPVVLTCSLAAAIIKAQFQTQDTMQTQTG